MEKMDGSIFGQPVMDGGDQQLSDGRFFAIESSPGHTLACFYWGLVSLAKKDRFVEGCSLMLCDGL